MVYPDYYITKMAMKLFTIGHSNHSPEDFLSLLQKHEITALADVRSHPYSHHLPHFNQKPLKTILEKYGIAYVFLGQELGARSNNPDCYVNGKALYERIANTPEFLIGLERVCQGVVKYRIALMCAEKDPITCHRAILVCPPLKIRGLEIQHILKNGDLETQFQLEERLLELHKLKSNLQTNTNHITQPGLQLSLFDIHSFNELQNQPNSVTKKLTYDELVKKAYALQGEQIAYIDKNWQEKSHEQID